jgi:hypothetical protein
LHSTLSEHSQIYNERTLSNPTNTNILTACLSCNRKYDCMVDWRYSLFFDYISCSQQFSFMLCYRVNFEIPRNCFQCFVVTISHDFSWLLACFLFNFSAVYIRGIIVHAARMHWLHPWIGLISHNHLQF